MRGGLAGDQLLAGKAGRVANDEESAVGAVGGGGAVHLDGSATRRGTARRYSIDPSHARATTSFIRRQLIEHCQIDKCGRDRVGVLEPYRKVPSRRCAFGASNEELWMLACCAVTPDFVIPVT